MLGSDERTARNDRRGKHGKQRQTLAALTRDDRGRLQASPMPTEQLRRMVTRYVEEDATVEELSAEFGGSPSTIARRLRKEGVELRPRGPARTAPRVKRVCKCCGDTFEMSEAQVRANPERRFCDPICAYYGPDRAAQRAALRAFHARLAAALRSEGLEPLSSAAELLAWAPATVRRLGKVPTERRVIGRRVMIGVNARVVNDRSPDKDARRKLSKPLAALNGTMEDIGRPRALSDAELAMVLELRSTDPKAWSWRRLAEELNKARPPEKPVSHMAVKRAFERQPQARLARVTKPRL